MAHTIVSSHSALRYHRDLFHGVNSRMIYQHLFGSMLSLYAVYNKPYTYIEDEETSDWKMFGLH